jgi:3-oxoacyl-[acyl-carrier-protein] synthase II
VKPSLVTGLGVVSTVGIGRESFFGALRRGSAAPAGPARRIESFDADKYATSGFGANIAEVPEFDAGKYLGDKGLRTLDRLTKLLIVAARLALHDAGFKKDGVYVQASPERVGIVCSNAYGSLEAITELDRVARLEDARYINPAKFPNTVSNTAAGYASIWEELRAVNVSVSDGNCGALDAVACANVFLETGRADALLVGGAEAMSEPLFLAFHKLGALGRMDAPANDGASLGGTRLGEGAVLLVTETRELAERRGASSFGELAGYGTAFVAPAGEASLIHASEEAMDRAIEGALADAGVSAGELDLVVSGVSGLRLFDEAEVAAIARRIPQAVPVAAPKLLLGETLGAGGGMAMAAALAWMNAADAEPPPYPLVRGTPSGTGPRSVLVTSLGYYGNASAVVMKR